MKFVTAIFPPYTGKQTYTYQTELDAKPGDYFVVKTPSNGYQVVKIRGTDVSKPDFVCKPLIQKVVDNT